MAHGDITHQEIPYLDKERQIAFYGAVFEWQIGEMPGMEGYPLWQAPNQVSGGGFGPREGHLLVPRMVVEVESIEATIVQVEALGGRLIEGKQPIDDTSWWAVIADPEDNIIGLWEGPTSGRTTPAP